MLYTTNFANNPFALVRRMSRGFDNGFGMPEAAFPAVNVWQNDEAVAITAELPGVEPSDIEITVRDNVLTLAGERKRPEFGEDARWHRRERAYGRFSRTIRLPYAARDEQVEARFADGILRIAVARPEEDKPRRIQIKAA